jgi:protein involved in polysaccharide export with SLBB domain
MLREIRQATQWAGVYAAVCLMGCLLWPTHVQAQKMPPLPPPVLLSANSNTPQASTGGLQTNPQLAMREFEPAENQEYELGRGDSISIDFAGRPEMSSKQIVGPDGMITLPMAGSIAVADKTRPQAAQAIVAALTPYYEHLNVTVGVDKYTSNQVLLLGAVEHPGVLTFDRPPTLLEAVSRGGALGGARNSGEPATDDFRRAGAGCDLPRRGQSDLGGAEKTVGQRKRAG